MTHRDYLLAAIALAALAGIVIAEAMKPIPLRRRAWEQARKVAGR